ncbi:14-3-3 domain containing protein [Trema orientale]|uniref:14-3-3 domain containing protein n=1 Tax=Trema orientale TaxID=63057 RepID=A0A2P5CQE9_TREOI|nr:14-3-3 domain containing protein [Trema orientale]
MVSPFCKLAEFMETIFENIENERLTIEEWNLLCITYKNVIRACNASWYIISSSQAKGRES